LPNHDRRALAVAHQGRREQFAGWCVLCLVLILPFLSFPLANVAASVRQVTSIIPSSNYGQFSKAMALSGNTLVVGEPMINAASVYIRTANGWALQARLTMPARSDDSYRRFGEVVAISGDTIAIAAPWQDIDTPSHADDAGLVYVFGRTGTTWQLQQEVIQEPPVIYSEYGIALHLTDTRLLIGGSQRTSGTVFDYRRSNGRWQLRTQLTSPNNITGGGFGRSIVGFGDHVLIGAPYADAAYLFKQTPTGWQQERQFVPTVTAPYTHGFGTAVALSDDTLAISTPREVSDSLPATVDIYVRTSGQWLLQTRLSRDDSPQQMSFGMNLALQGDRLLIGAPRHNLEGYDVPNEWGSGVAFLYQRTGTTWSLAASLSGNHLQPTNAFGQTTIISGSELLIGAMSSLAGSSMDGIIYTSYLDRLSQAVHDTVVTPEEQPITIPVLANDLPGAAGSLDPAYLDVTLLNRPRYGVAQVDMAAGTIIYTPTTNFTGVDSFGYKAGWGTPATVTVTVSHVPDPPTITSLPPMSAVEGVPYLYELTLSDPDPNDQWEFSASGVPPWLTLQTTGSQTAVLTGTATFDDVGQYPLELQVTDEDGLAASQAFTLTVEPFIPSAPHSLQAEVRSSSQIALHWADTSSNEQGFRIERQTAGGSWETIVIVDPDQVSFIDGQRMCNTLYRYRVRAFHQRGDSPPSAVQEVQISDCTIASPTNLRIQVASASRILLFWEDRSANEAGFRIESSPDGSTAWQMQGQVAQNRQQFSVDGLGCGNVRWYRVVSFNAGGESPPTPAVRANTCPPVAAADLTVAGATQTDLTLRWSDTSDNETGFRLERFDMATQQWSTVITLAAQQHEATHSGLQCGTDYQYRVMSYNGSGSAASAPLTATTAPCDVIYVRATAMEPADGRSWATAFPDLQAALQAATTAPPNTLQIWVAAGTYTPTIGNDRGRSFHLVNDTALYGGFAGNETNLAQRDWRANPTILSGNIGDPTSVNDNSYQVVTSSLANPTTLLDGFIITQGRANGSFADYTNYGAGMWNDRSSPTIRNCSFIGNAAHTGGGMANTGADLWDRVGSRPVVEQVIFLGNSAERGGGMSNMYGSAPQLTNVLFSGNRAIDGGGLHNYWDAVPVLSNTTFSGNTASLGAAILNSAGGRPVVLNSIFWGNQAGSFGGPVAQIFNEDSNSFATVSDSLLQGNLTNGIDIGGVRNRILDPRFVDADGADNVIGTFDDDTQLQETSPAIDAGNNASFPLAITSDLAGNPRFTDHISSTDSGLGVAPLIDIGAYEFQPAAPARPTLTMDHTIGKAGSFFLITTNGIEPASEWNVTVNDIPLGHVLIGADGTCMILLQTDPVAESGTYVVRLVPEHSHLSETAPLTNTYTLDSAAPLRSRPETRVDYTLLVPLDQQPETTLMLYIPFIIH
jgi:hypothetical protein